MIYVYIIFFEIKMDVLSQAVIGSLFAVVVVKDFNKFKVAIICGMLAGMSPDLDILIRSSQDPLLAIEFHRHFTHSLFFIPIGSLIIGFLIWFIIYRKKISFKEIYLYSFLGFASHGILDSCTAYGTMLYWPFNHDRISWNFISIIDPLFTIPIIVIMFFGYFYKKQKIMICALLFGLSYMSLGAIQNYNINNYIDEIATKRGHNNITRKYVAPSFGNIILWRTIYLYDGKYYIDAVNYIPFTKHIVYKGESTNYTDIDAIKNSNDFSSRFKKDIIRFNKFTQGYSKLTYNEQGQSFIGDLRYSILPNSKKPMWGILDNNAITNFNRNINRNQENFSKFWQMLLREF